MVGTNKVRCRGGCVLIIIINAVINIRGVINNNSVNAWPEIEGDFSPGRNAALACGACATHVARDRNYSFSALATQYAISSKV